MPSRPSAQPLPQKLRVPKIVTQNQHVVNQIVERGLCVRCAACEPACPWDIIRLDNRHFPLMVDEAKCPTGCTRCLKVCPGGDVNFTLLDEEMFGQTPDPRSITGFATRAFVAFARDENVRYAGASGGLATQLLSYMMDKGIIDGALVVGTRSEGAGWEPEPFIARTVEDLKRAAKSKYTVLPHLRPLREMEGELEGNYAAVAVPCYVHALRKYQKVSPKLRKRLKFIIGLYCNVVFEPHIVSDVAAAVGLRDDEVEDLRFRHGDWPGGVVVKGKDGSERKLLKLEEMKDEFNLLKLFYAAPRCNMCIDFSAEYADIALGDPWLRGPDGRYLFEDGRTAGIVRTEMGDTMLKEAVSEGYIDVEDIPLSVWMTNFEFSGRYKRDFVPKALKLRSALGLAVPEYHRSIDSGSWKGWPAVLMKTAVLRLSRHPWIRGLSLTLAQTPPALAYFRWNRRRKERAYAKEYPRRVAFADEIIKKSKLPTEGHPTEKA